MSEWLQEALSHRHSPRAVIVIGLEDGRFAVLDELSGTRHYYCCETIAHIEQHLVALRDRELNSMKVARDAASANELLQELGL